MPPANATPPCVLITGCDAGIGREFARQYDAAGWTVFATYKSLDNAIAGGNAMRHHALDVTDPHQFAAVKAALADAPIDLLVSNAGVGLDIRKLGDLDFAYVHEMLEINTIGALRLVDTFVDNVAASSQRRIVAITSRMASISLNLSGGHYGYRASKAGLNAIMHSLAIDLFSRGITVNAIHPGWVTTAGGGGGGAISVAESVDAMRRLVARLGSHETGQFYNYNGELLSW